MRTQLLRSGGSAFLKVMREYKFFVYIMASKSRVLYTGITNDLAVRVFQHKTGRFAGFTKQYRVHRLVYFESFQYVRGAIAREKEIKHWTRLRRVQLIELDNPVWDDLAASWFSDQLLADPNAPAVIDYDPTMAARKRDYVFNNASPEQPVRIKFRSSRTQRFEERKD
jgi:putative endonuclease